MKIFCILTSNRLQCSSTMIKDQNKWKREKETYLENFLLNFESFSYSSRNYLQLVDSSHSIYLKTFNEFREEWNKKKLLWFVSCIFPVGCFHTNDFLGKFLFDVIKNTYNFSCQRLSLKKFTKKKNQNIKVKNRLSNLKNKALVWKIEHRGIYQLLPEQVAYMYNKLPFLTHRVSFRYFYLAKKKIQECIDLLIFISCIRRSSCRRGWWELTIREVWPSLQ